MSFSLPQALVLLVPLGLFLWMRGARPGPPMPLRWGLLVLAVAALAGPELVLRHAGSDVVVVVDRSRSMPLVTIPTRNPSRAASSAAYVTVPPRR